MKKNMKALFSSPANTMTTMATMMTMIMTMATATMMPTVATTMTVMAMMMAMAAPWLLTKNGKVRMPLARKMAKLWCVKPVVDYIVNVGNAKQQASVLCAVTNHPLLAAARELARIVLSNEQSTTKYLCEQLAWMLGRACSSKNAHGKATRDHHAAKVVLTSTAPSPNRDPVIPSQRTRACLLGIAPSLLDHVDDTMIQKRQQLIAGESGIYWAIPKEKKGYSKISVKLKLLLLNAFDDQPHAVVLPKTKDTLQVKIADGKIMLVRKKLTMVGLGTIFLDIVQDNPTIKNKVGKHAFRYIVSGLGCVC